VVTAEQPRVQEMAHTCAWCGAHPGWMMHRIWLMPSLVAWHLARRTRRLDSALLRSAMTWPDASDWHGSRKHLQKADESSGSWTHAISKKTSAGTRGLCSGSTLHARTDSEPTFAWQ
jgi:hypothetical protein